jgi:hypothetical protein
MEQSRQWQWDWHGDERRHKSVLGDVTNSRWVVTWHMGGFVLTTYPSASMPRGWVRGSRLPHLRASRLLGPRVSNPLARHFSCTSFAILDNRLVLRTDPCRCGAGKYSNETAATGASACVDCSADESWMTESRQSAQDWERKMRMICANRCKYKKNMRRMNCTEPCAWTFSGEGYSTCSSSCQPGTHHSGVGDSKCFDCVEGRFSPNNPDSLQASLAQCSTYTNWLVQVYWSMSGLFRKVFRYSQCNVMLHLHELSGGSL